jgi:hypothetical protein
METVNIALSGLLIAAVSGLLSYIVAKKYGDLAGIEASRRLHEEDMKKARLTAIRSLLNEAERIRKIANHNRQLDKFGTIQAVIRLPMAAFETAFVAGRPGLDVSEELVKAVTDYLVCADSVNSLIDIYPASMASPRGSDGAIMGVAGTSRAEFVIQQVIEISAHELPEILERLRILLQEEI